MALPLEFATLAAGSELEIVWEAAKLVTPLVAICGLWFKAGQWQAQTVASIAALAEKTEVNTKQIEANTKQIEEITKQLQANTKQIEANARQTGDNTTALTEFRTEIRTEISIVRADIRALADKFERINYDVAFLTGYRTAQERAVDAATRPESTLPRQTLPPRE